MCSLRCSTSIGYSVFHGSVIWRVGRERLERCKGICVARGPHETITSKRAFIGPMLTSCRHHRLPSLPALVLARTTSATHHRLERALQRGCLRRNCPRVPGPCPGRLPQHSATAAAASTLHSRPCQSLKLQIPCLNGKRKRKQGWKPSDWNGKRRR